MVDKSNLITFSQVISEVKKYIKTICHNIDSFSSSVDVSLRNGSTYIIAQGSKQTITATVTDSLAVVVPSSIVESQLLDFLSSRGIAFLDDDLITVQNLLYLMNNIASFLTTRIVFVSAGVNNRVSVFYNKNPANYLTVGGGLKDIGNIQSAYLLARINEISNLCGNVLNMHKIVTSIQVACSSSSSSCSSSSSSSSSSVYIAYMII